MTTHKDFKQLVRARMARTGERYAAARRALLADGTGPGPAPTRVGLYPATASLARVLADRGVTSAVTGAPLTESMILGIGGGLGAGYILWEFRSHGSPYLTLGFSNRWQYPGVPGWLGTTLERLGIRADVHETGGQVGARASLDRILDDGRSVIAFIDQQVLGIWGQPDELAGYSGYQVVVSGRAKDGAYLIDDRGSAPLEISPETLAAARARIGSFKHRLVDPRSEPQSIAPGRLREMVEAGLADQVDHLRSPSDSFSLPAWRKWSRLMTDTRNAKAWPRVFPDGAGLFGALLSIAESVDGDAGVFGGHLRALYATFLDDAAALLDRPALGTAAVAWREAADQWDDLADAAVPADIPGAAEALAAAEALNAAVMAGEPGRADAREAARRLWAIRAEWADAPGLAAERSDEILADLGRRLAAIHARRGGGARGDGGGDRPAQSAAARQSKSRRRSRDVGGVPCEMTDSRCGR